MPTVVESLNLAEQALTSGDLARAQFIYERILQAAPDEPRALNGLGMIAYRAGRMEEAETYLRRAVDQFADDPAFHNNLNLVHRALGRPGDAVDCCRAALKLDPDCAELHNNLGLALGEDGWLESAADSLRRAIELKPQYSDAHYNLANALVQLRRLEEAEGEFRRAIELAPGDNSAYNNLGSLLQLTGRFSEAMSCFDTAIRLQPQSAEAHRNRALLSLLLGDFAPAWPEYEWRWRMPGTHRPPFTQPLWQGQPLDGRTLLLWGEQGLGDVIQMIRYAPLVKRLGATVLVECRGVLHGLLSTAPGIDRFVDTTAGDVTFDYYIPLMSLPAAFTTTLETIPTDVPYLFATADGVAHWRRKLAGYEGFKVGIAWQGSPGFTGDYHRSIPLAAYAPLAECPGVTLFSLQKGYGREQLAQAPFGDSITDLGAQQHDLRDAAAIVSNLDLVITSDSAPAHLAGALGVPVWVALQLAPNWRWLLERDDSPWYPTMRLFRQTQFGDWADVLRRIAEALTADVSERHQS